MATFLPTDDNNNPIPALRLKDGGAYAIAATTTAAANLSAFPATTQVISIYATVPVFLKFSENGAVATASDHYFPAGVYYDFAIGGEEAVHYNYLSVLRSGASDGIVYVSEKI